MKMLYPDGWPSNRDDRASALRTLKRLRMLLYVWLLSFFVAVGWFYLGALV